MLEAHVRATPGVSLGRAVGSAVIFQQAVIGEGLAGLNNDPAAKNVGFSPGVSLRKRAAACRRSEAILPAAGCPDGDRGLCCDSVRKRRTTGCGARYTSQKEIAVRLAGRERSGGSCQLMTAACFA